MLCRREFLLKTARSSKVALISVRPVSPASPMVKRDRLWFQAPKPLQPAHSFRVSVEERRPASRTPFRLRRDSTRVETQLATSREALNRASSVRQDVEVTS